MDARLVQAAISLETDIVLVRQRARRLAELVGFDRQEQTRITTAVSEIARNAFEYAGGGTVEFRLQQSGGSPSLVIVVHDAGPGIADVEAILAGERRSAAGMGVGLIGARRLMDGFAIDTRLGAGTSVRLVKHLPQGSPALAADAVSRITAALAADAPASPMEEIRRQNQHILLQMQELRAHHEDLEKLNQELQDTNRGVVALYAELDERADHLRRADETKSRFLSHMSHEFRTPLNSILALSRLLLSRNDGALTDEQDKQVCFIRKAAKDLTELVNDLLDIAKVEAGKTVVTPAEFSVESLFGTLRGMLRPLLVGEAVALVFEEQPILPPLYTDEAKVSQILRNFISNAIKFTEHGEIRVWAAAAAADTVTFHVRDTGIGIAAGDLDLIFQDFGQVTHRLQGRAKGTGLGLPLARRLTELLGGGIDVESGPGQGSTFSVTVPRVYRGAEADAAAEPGVQIEPGKLLVEDDPADAFIVDRVAGRRSATRVVLLDDEAVAGYLTGQLLPHGRYSLRIAQCGQQALDLLGEQAADVILLDLNMPGMDGWEFLRRLRASPCFGMVPVIVVTAAVLDAEALRRLGGVAGVLAKSQLTAETLRAAIASAIGPAGTMAAA